MYVPFDEMPKEARVWLYPYAESFTEEEIKEANVDIKNFVEEWLSHGQSVKGSGTILFGRILCLTADEKSSANVGGCSIDSSTRFITQLEKKYNKQKSDRSLVVYQISGTQSDVIGFRDLSQAVQDGKLNKDTLVFNIQSENIADLDAAWIPLSESAYSRFV
ncbi:MAG: hypothetical protein M9887_08450 [Chitinophagales bacterium]|nr:hypothetical protein [Chitinophagales bacterium]